MSACFDLHDVSVSYEGRRALTNVTLRIAHGERVALVGRSGAGKSTLLRLLFERALADAALVPQEHGLVKALSVFHNVYMGKLRQHGALYNLANLVRPMRRELQAALPVVRELGLEDKLFEPVGQLSGGQQQRTAVARALHQGSPVAMADEPVSAVDEHQSRRVLDAIVERHDTVVLAMHDTALAIAYSDRIVGLNDGHVTLDRPTNGMRPSDLDVLYAD